MSEHNTSKLNVHKRGGVTQLIATLLTAHLALASQSAAKPQAPQGSTSAQEKDYQVNPIHLQPSTEEEIRIKGLADEAYSNGDLNATLKHLQAAYEVSKNPRYIANQGLVLADSGRYSEAIKALEYFINTNPPLPKLRSARAEINRLRPEVHLITTPPGASVTLTESKQSLGQSPITTHLVAGEHMITISKPGFDTQQIPLMIFPGKPISLQYTLIRRGRSLDEREQASLEGAQQLNDTPLGPPSSEADASLSARLSAPASSAVKPLPAGAKQLLWVGVGASVFSGAAQLLARDAVITRDAASNRAAWERAQGEASVYHTLSLGSAALAVVSAVASGVWWVVSEAPRPPAAR